MTYLENGLLLPVLMLEYLSSGLSPEHTQDIQNWLSDDQVDRISFEPKHCVIWLKDGRKEEIGLK